MRRACICAAEVRHLLTLTQRTVLREEGVIRGVALSDDGMEQAGMGVGVGDYDLDGHLDLFRLTSLMTPGAFPQQRQS